MKVGERALCAPISGRAVASRVRVVRATKAEVVRMKREGAMVGCHGRRVHEGLPPRVGFKQGEDRPASGTEKSDESERGVRMRLLPRTCKVFVPGFEASRSWRCQVRRFCKGGETHASLQRLSALTELTVDLL